MTAQPATSPTSPTNSDKAQRKAHWLVMLTMWEVMTDAFPSWRTFRGTIEGAIIKDWARALFGFPEERIMRTAQQLAQAPDRTTLPTLDGFKHLLEPLDKPAQPDLATAAVRDRELKRQAQIPTSPKSREASAADVESFETSYHKLGLDSRWRT